MTNSSNNINHNTNSSNNINHNIIKSIFFTVAVLLIISFFNLPDYHIFVYGAALVLLLIGGSISFNMISGPSVSAPTIITKIIYLWLIAIPLGFLQFVHLKYKSHLSQNINKDTKYRTLLYIISFSLLIQIIVLYHGLMRHNLSLLYSSIMLSLINIFLSGLIWRDVAFFVTDGFTVNHKKK
jgi:hypothetical protein